jgi:hypothetical protein
MPIQRLPRAPSSALILALISLALLLLPEAVAGMVKPKGAVGKRFLKHTRSPPQALPLAQAPSVLDRIPSPRHTLSSPGERPKIAQTAMPELPIPQPPSPQPPDPEAPTLLEPERPEIEKPPEPLRLERGAILLPRGPSRSNPVSNTRISRLTAWRLAALPSSRPSWS